MINIKPQHLDIVKNILSKYPYNFYLFGSRLSKKAKNFSDIDLFYKEDIPINMIIKLEEEFEESDLPYKVDIVNYNNCSIEFQKIMEQKHINLQDVLKQSY